MEGLKSLIAGMQYVRETLNKDFPLQHLMLFLTVADNPSITMPELSKKLGVPQGTISRTYKALSRYVADVDAMQGVERVDGKKEFGYGLLRAEPDLYNRRALALYLTDRGDEVLGGLLSAMGRD